MVWLSIEHQIYTANLIDFLGHPGRRISQSLGFSLHRTTQLKKSSTSPVPEPFKIRDPNLKIGSTTYCITTSNNCVSGFVIRVLIGNIHGFRALDPAFTVTLYYINTSPCATEVARRFKSQSIPVCQC
jgi:hypothetical protein